MVGPVLALCAGFLLVWGANTGKFKAIWSLLTTDGAQVHVPNAQGGTTPIAATTAAQTGGFLYGPPSGVGTTDVTTPPIQQITGP